MVALPVVCLKLLLKTNPWTMRSKSVKLNNYLTLYTEDFYYLHVKFLLKSLYCIKIIMPVNRQTRFLDEVN